MEDFDGAQQVELKTTVVDIPERGKRFHLRELDGVQRDIFEIASFKANGEGKAEVDKMLLRARLVGLSLVRPNGEAIYPETDPTKCARDLPGEVINTLFVEAQKLSGLDGGADKEAAKNSSGVQSEDSTSGLH